MLWNMMSQGRQAFVEWRQKKTLREMLNDPRSAKGCRSIGQLEKGIAADRATTERLLLTIGARRAELIGTMDAGSARKRIALSLRADACRARYSMSNGSLAVARVRPHTEITEVAAGTAFCCCPPPASSAQLTPIPSWSISKTRTRRRPAFPDWENNRSTRSPCCRPPRGQSPSRGFHARHCRCAGAPA